MALAGSLLLAIALPGFAHEVAGLGHDIEAQANTRIDQEGDVRPLLRAFRETGDDEFLDQAWRIVEPALAKTRATADQLVDAAFVAQSRHEFELAMKLLGEAIRRRPNDDQAWLLLSAIQLVRGEPGAAAQSCAKLRQAPIIIALTCRARVALAFDDFAHARDKLDAYLSVVDARRVRPDWLAWSLGVAGDLAAASDRAERAIDNYRRSLQFSESTQVRAALADVLILHGRFEEAAKALDHGAPALPLEVRRLVVATRLGKDREFAADIEAADRTFQAWIAANDWVHAREMARFYLDVVCRPRLARQLAAINLTLQREPEDIRLARRTGTETAMPPNQSR